MVDSVTSGGGTSTLPSTPPTSILDTIENAYNLDFEDLMKLKLTEIQNQDPTKPMDTAELVRSFTDFTNILSTQKNAAELAGMRTDQNNKLEAIIDLLKDNFDTASMEEALAQLVDISGQQQGDLNTLNQKIAELYNSQYQMQNGQYVMNMSLEQMLGLAFVDRQLMVEQTEAAMKDGKVNFAYFLPENTKDSQITIKDSSGNVVATLQGKTSSGLYDMAWDGTTDGGGKLTEGTFSISVTATTMNRSEVSSNVREVSAEDFNSLQNGKLEFGYSLDSATESAYAEIFNEDGEMIRRINLNLGEGAHQATWDGKDTDGAAVDAEGKYQVKVTTVYAEDDTAEVDASVYRNMGASGHLADGSMAITYTLPSAVSYSNVVILDQNGNKVRTLDGANLQGNYTMVWDGKNDAGTQLADGMYTVRIDTFSGDSSELAAETYVYKKVVGVQSAGLGNTFLVMEDEQKVSLADAFAMRSV